MTLEADLEVYQREKARHLEEARRFGGLIKATKNKIAERDQEAEAEKEPE